MCMYEAEYDQDWVEFFDKLSNGLKIRVAKKIGKIIKYPNKRHLKKSSFFVDEVGQYRITYMVFDKIKKFIRSLI
jgi:hypothetical protein